MLPAENIMDRLFSMACCNSTRNNSFKIEGRFRSDKEEFFFYNEGGETVEQVAERW